MNIFWLRLVLSAVFLLMTGLIVTWAIGPVLSSMTRAEQDEGLVRRYQELAAEGPRLQQAANQLRGELANGNTLFMGSSAELASANLQTDLQDMIAATGGQIETSEIGTPQIVQGLEQLTISLDISLPGDRLPTLLKAIDEHKPYLFVQGMDVRPRDNFNSSRMLDLDMRISGFRNVE